MPDLAVAEDGFHPGAMAYKIWADAAARTIREKTLPGT